MRMPIELEQYLRSLDRISLSDVNSIFESFTCAANAIWQGIEGDFVECGVFAGAQCIAMAQAIQLYEPDKGRKVHLFDTFAGLPYAPGEFDQPLFEKIEGIGSRPFEKGTMKYDLETVKRNIEAYGIQEKFLEFHVGAFEDTITAATLERIAILRLDGDLYQSTKTCMTHLYPKLSYGGYCIVDDFKLDGVRKAIYEFVTPGPITFKKE